MTNRSRSSSSGEGELRLPRPPGILRRYWARHPLFADILVTVVCLLVSTIPVIATPILPEGVGTNSREWRQVLPALSVVVVLGCLALLLRRRHPLIVLASSYVVALAYLFAPAPINGPLLLIATYSVAVYVSSRAALVGVVIGMAVLAGTGFVLSATGVSSTTVVWGSLVNESLSSVIGGLIGANVGSRARYVTALIDHSQRLVVERDQQAQLAASTERERIARELHDIVAHSLTVMVALAEGVAASRDVDRSRPGVEAIAATGREALRDMRATLGILRESEAAPLAPLARDTTAETVASARAAGFDTRLVVSGDPGDLDSRTQLAVSRIVQEGVTNVLRHATAATHIDVAIRHAPDGVSVTIADDGLPVSADAGSGGFGLRGLRERVELAGGTVTAGPRQPHGWSVAAHIPRQETTA
ncbi:sensor histidine kinase [Microbacterium sp. NPDC091382]|uniref:sensor histidine kinase n=1 Tax=Microbacterium sp. NPDC091382 TaxID=3364210 RepID=UPI0038270DCF